MSDGLATLFKSAVIGELEGLRTQIRDLVAPLSEEQFWHKATEPGNSAGHLVLHLTGNLSHFIGAQLGNTGYQRNREREFTEQAPPAKAVALERLDDTIALCRRVIEGLSPEQLAGPHPEPRFPSVLQALVYLTSHFAMHRGQISYIVRLVRGSGS